MFKSSADLSAFWDNTVEQLLTAGVDFVAVDIRGFVPGSAQPDGGGDPRIVTGLVDAINRRGVADQLKIAALDDTPASLVDKKNQVKHHTGGYDPAFDLSDADGTGEGGYDYFWKNNQRPYFAAVPAANRLTIDGRPVIYEWSLGSPLFTNQGNGNASKLLQYARQQAKTEFGVNPYYIVDQSWPKVDPTTVSQVDGVNNWFNMANGGKTVNTYRPIANNDLVTYGAGWSLSSNRGLGDYQNDVHYTTTAGATAQYTFIGTGVQYLAERNGDEGSVDVYLDGVLQSTVNLNVTGPRQVAQVVFEKTGLANGSHTIKVVNRTAGRVAMIDGFKVTAPGQSASLDGRKYGVAVPGFHVVRDSTNMVIDPNHGQTLVDNLTATVNAGADITLVEGFTDWFENAALWRTAEGTYDQRHADYPSQMIDILRRFSRTPFPENFTVEAEAADGYSDTTPGNQLGAYRDGGLDVGQTTDTNGTGWYVGDTAAGESLQWQDIPMQGTVALKARVAAAQSGGKLRFVIDGVPGPVVDVPATGGAQTYQTVDAGVFSFSPLMHHKVSIEIVAGGFNLNDWRGTPAPGATPSTSPQPTPVGTTVSLKASNGKYVTAGSSNGYQLTATASSAGAAEKFDVVSLGGDQVQLRAQSNRKFVTAEDGGAAPLVANRDTAQGWETFTLVRNSDGTVTLQAKANGKYVTSNNGASPLIANQAAIKGWEKFTMTQG